MFLPFVFKFSEFFKASLLALNGPFLVMIRLVDLFPPQIPERPLRQMKGRDISTGNFSNPLPNFRQNMVYLKSQLNFLVQAGWQRGKSAPQRQNSRRICRVGAPRSRKHNCFEAKLLTKVFDVDCSTAIALELPVKLDHISFTDGFISILHSRPSNGTARSRKKRLPIV